MSVGEIIIPTSFDSLPATQVLRSEQLLGALWSSADNTVDVRTGALQSLVLQPFATLLEASREAFRLGGQQSDLNYLSTADPSDERVAPLLDSLAANYRITRKIGTAATGVLRLVFSRRATISVSPSDIFTANGLSFIPMRQFTADSREGFTSGNTHFYSMPDVHAANQRNPGLGTSLRTSTRRLGRSRQRSDTGYTAIQCGVEHTNWFRH